MGLSQQVSHISGDIHGSRQFRILKEGTNCWRMARAGRAAFLVDTESYFSNFAKAVLNARHSILICGWDIDSRIPLFRDNKETPFPNRLGEFLNWAVSKNPGLHAYVLVWDFAMIYALERELLPVFKLGWRTNRRLHFRMDGNHPVWASHHQKIVVIDDALAFVGGMDLTKCRWDTSGHIADDPRRSDPGCPRYGPFHDVQMAVDGDAASALGQLVRERWFRATGRRIQSAGRAIVDPWPSGLVPDMEEVSVAIARTEPQYKDNSEIREVERLYSDSIKAARKYIYMENQYLASSIVCELLASRLQEPDCPEIVIVVPKKSSGWFEEGTMDALRSRIMQRLRAVDRQGKLRIYYPKLPGYNQPLLNVHAKISIIDNDFARVGSSNLSNRSMGFDTECDLAIEAGGESRLESAVIDFRARLLAEHLGVTEEMVASTIARKESLIAAIESLRGGERTLEELDGSEAQEIFDSYVYDTSLIDPECAAMPAEMIDQFLPDEVKRSGVRPLVWGVLTLLVLFGLAAAWTWTPLGKWVNLDLLLHYTSLIAGRKSAALIVFGAYIVGGIVQFPVTLLIVATAITFEPLTALFYSLAGSVVSAACVYWFGRLLGRNAVQRFGGERLNRLSRKLARQGILTIIMIRIFPIGPFSFINFVAGASQIRFADFVFGTVIGMLPGLIAITFLGDRLGETLRHPKLENFLFLAGLILFFAGANICIRRWLDRRKRGKGSDTTAEGKPPHVI